MDGVIIVDKPAGWTSHDVVAKLRGVLRVKRVGHGGTLDPMATGVLPVFVGRATRAAGFLTNAGKEYIAGLRLGIATDTQDITGKMLSACDAAINAEELAAAISAEELTAAIPRFLGPQKQVPPMYSAVRHEGEKLYELARRGIEVEREAREVFISEIELIGEGGKNEFMLRVACSKGTYIRTLCHDIGAALGCGGAMSSLRRTVSGAFDVSMAYPLDAVLDAVSSGEAGRIMRPLDSVFTEYPAATLDGDQTRRCKNGARCGTGGIPDGKYRFYDPDGEFFLFGEAVNGEIKTIKRF